MATHQFQTEVNQLLNIIVHSLYSQREIFLRELISNASDALDKLKYWTLTDDNFKEFPFDPRIDIEFDETENKWLKVSDTGIGMNEEDLVEQLGTIASSGTKNFVNQLTGDQKKDSNLIGQFGVGFYSAFMVAHKVEVLSRKAGEDEAYRWISDGQGEYEVEAAEKAENGTEVTLYLNEDATEFANRWQIEQIVKKYSDHVAFPIYLHYEKVDYDNEGKETNREQTVDQVNSASALWRRPKNEISEEEYNEFYKMISHDNSDPLITTHTHAEGTIEYTTLFFVPQQAPFDMYYADYQPGVKLYVNRVFITDDEKELLPTYLRFVRGVIDSEDLPLNVSREMLQKNKVLSSIRNNSVKKLLNEFSRVAQEEPEKYQTFISQFNRPLKEGLYQDFQNRDTLMDLVRFKSTKAEGYTSLADYKSRMLPDQKAIYYITGEDEGTLRNSPLLEAYKKKDIEVLIMDDEIDELVVPSIGTYDEVELKPVNRSDAGEDLKSEEDKEAQKDLEPVIEKIKKALGDRVKDVRFSVRLSDSPSCIVLDENDPSIKMQEIMKAMGQQQVPEVTPILEVNPNHHVVKQLKGAEDEALIEDVSYLLLDQALLVENMPLKEPTTFVQRLNRVLEKAV